jgi:hypothetical protein
MSLIQSIELHNYESFRDAKFVFDETNILNIKGFNDSGKSAVLRAVGICLMDLFKMKQSEFIKHGCDYFRIVVTFDDGVSILRDKYKNGQSLYEMYLNDELQFTTKQGDRLSKVTGVPDLIANYLNLCVTEDVYLNYQGSRDPLPVVDFSGSKNYRMFHEVFRVTEITRATQMINTDRNELNSDISILENNLHKYEVLLEPVKEVTQELVDAIRELETESNLLEKKKLGVEECVTALNNIVAIKENPHIEEVSRGQLKNIDRCYSAVNMLESIKIHPEISGVDERRLKGIHEVSNVFANLKSIEIQPSLDGVDNSRLKALSNIMSSIDQIKSLEVPVEVGKVSYSKLSALSTVKVDLSMVLELSQSINNIDDELTSCKKELEGLEKSLDSTGGKYIKCTNCGTILEVGEVCGH